MSFDFSKYRIVDLSPQVVAALKTADGKELEGTPDPLGEGASATERIAKGGDFTKHTRLDLHGHVGAHTEGGKGHIDHFPGYEKQTGLWELPLDAFYGEAAVINLSSLKPLDKKSEDDDSFRGQPIKPEHLTDVKKGDIVLMWSPYDRPEAPYLPEETTKWLLKTEIKMLGVQLPGVRFDTPEAVTHKILLTNNITITYPLANLDQLQQSRVFYMGLPINIARLEATWVRAIAIEERNDT